MVLDGFQYIMVSRHGGVLSGWEHVVEMSPVMVWQEIEKAGRTSEGFHLQSPSLSDLSLLSSTQSLK